MKIGIELEYWVIDDNGQLTTADEIIDAHGCVVPEFVESLVEIQVPPVETKTELQQELADILSTVLDAAHANGKHLVPLGTPLTEHDLPIISERGELLEQMYGDELRYAKNCAGTHVHFDKGNVVRQLNLLTALDPVLALVNSSPYYDGERLASSSRASVYRLGANSRFTRYRDLWVYVDSVEEWNARIATEYKLLRTIAHDQGISTEDFDRHFHPENSVLTPVRLREQSPTVEWRAPDTALPSQIVELVGDVTELLQQTDQKEVVIGKAGVWADCIGIPTFAELRKLSTSAIADGLDSLSVRTYLTTMGFDITKYDPIAERFPAVDKLSHEEVRTLRLQSAAALEDDVRLLTTNTRNTSDVLPSDGVVSPE